MVLLMVIRVMDDGASWARPLRHTAWCQLGFESQTKSHFQKQVVKGEQVRDLLDLWDLWEWERERERIWAFVDSLHRPICECVLLSGICSQFYIFPPAPIHVFQGLIIDGYGNLTPIGTLGNRIYWRIWALSVTFRFSQLQHSWAIIYSVNLPNGFNVDLNVV